MSSDRLLQTETAKLQQRIGHTFQHPELLQRALTHSSLAFERATDGQASLPGGQKVDERNIADNEQLEFLGDAVVGLIAAESLYRRYPELREGELTRLRAALVSRQHLGQVGIKLDLGPALSLGKGEERSGGRKKPALVANAVEAVIAAIYLDAGIEAARVFIERWAVEPYVAELRAAIERGGSIGDHKSALQELLQARKAGQPQYLVKAESGPDHRKRFLVEVRVAPLDADISAGGAPRVLARGSGTTKKNAEQEAARRAYFKLAGQNPGPSFASESSPAPAAEETVSLPAPSNRVEELVS